MGINVAKTGYSRVFLIEGRAHPERGPMYMSCLKAGGASQGFGDVTNIECPSETDYDKFDVVDRYRGATERVTTTLTGRYASDVISEILRLARIGCALDVQVHIGACENPAAFNIFTKAVVFEDAFLLNWSTEDLGALGSDERSKIDESGDISGTKVFEIVRIGLSEHAGDVVTNEVVDVVICDSISCGECDVYSPGCNDIYAVTLAEGGSPGTPADVVYSLDGGLTWHTSEVDSLGVAENAVAIACIGGDVVVISTDSCSLHYVSKADLDTAGDETWTEVNAGFVDIGMGTCPMDIWSVGYYAFIAAEGGYVYGVENAADGAVILHAGTVLTDALRAIHALDRDFVVAVGSAGAVLYSEDGGVNWQAAGRPVGMGIDLHCVWVKSETEWWVGTSTGLLYYTIDGGDTWAQKAFPGSGTGRVDDIAFAEDSVAYLAHTTVAPAGRILRSYNGGYSWIVLPEGAGNIPGNQRIDALAACRNDVNMVVGVGLDDDGADGIVVLGTD